MFTSFKDSVAACITGFCCFAAKYPLFVVFWLAFTACLAWALWYPITKPIDGSWIGALSLLIILPLAVFVLGVFFLNPPPEIRRGRR